jgi:anti-anti-sigma factor
VTAPLADLEVTDSKGSVRVVVRGEIDLSNADELEQEIRDAVRGAKTVVLDLRPVAYIDSRGVRLLLQLSRALEAAQCSLTIVAPPESIAGGVLRLARVPGLDPEDARPS